MSTALQHGNVPRPLAQRRKLLRAGMQTLGIGTFYVLIVVFFSFASRSS